MENLQFRLDLGMKWSFCSASRSCLAMLRLSLKCVETPHREDDYRKEGMDGRLQAGPLLPQVSIAHIFRATTLISRGCVAQRGGDSTEVQTHTL